MLLVEVILVPGRAGIIPIMVVAMATQQRMAAPDITAAVMAVMAVTTPVLLVQYTETHSTRTNWVVAAAVKTVVIPEVTEVVWFVLSPDRLF